MSIFISIIGMLGLATFIARQRVKEIGIRKVLGASAIQIIKLLTSDFLRLILIANILVLPLAIWLISKWLEAYPYRISLDLWMFAGVIAISAMTVVVVIGLQSLHSALTNPVRSIRAE